MRSVLEDVILLALGAGNDLVNLASDRNEGIDKSINLVFRLRLCGLDQPTPIHQLCRPGRDTKMYVEIGH